MLTLLMVALTDLPDDPKPEDGDVVAGPLGFVMFILLILAVVLLLFSFAKQMRKVRAAREAGVFGEDAAEREVTRDETDGDHPGDGSAPR